MTQYEITRRKCNSCGYVLQHTKGDVSGGVPFADWWALFDRAIRYDVCGEVCLTKFAAGRLNNFAKKGN